MTNKNKRVGAVTVRERFSAFFINLLERLYGQRYMGSNTQYGTAIA